MNTYLRLNSFLELKNGWLDGKGYAPSFAFINKMASFFDIVKHRNIQHPYLYPTPEGGILAEWKVGNWDISFEINENSEAGFFHALNLNTDCEIQKEIPITDKGIDLLVAQLLQWKNV